MRPVKCEVCGHHEAVWVKTADLLLCPSCLSVHEEEYALRQELHVAIRGLIVQWAQQAKLQGWRVTEIEIFAEMVLEDLLDEIEMVSEET